VLEKEGHRVKILDAMALNLTTQEVKNKIIEEAADIVGVTAMTSSIKGALRVLQLAKDAGSVTIIGGPHLAVYPTETLSYDFIDYGIIGEGEYPFLNLIKSIEEKNPIEDISGLVYKEGREVRVNEAYIHLNLDEIPFPARHLLPMEKYSSLISLYPVATMISSRGCPYQCGFCFKGPSDKKYRVRSAKNVVDEMELLVKKYKVREIMFYDDTLTVQREHIANICNEILRRGLNISWESPNRIDTVDFKLLKLMRKAGCIRLRYGVESGDPTILRLMNKGIDLSRVREVFKWTKKAGIETFAYFIIGYIHETPQTMKNTILFAKSLNPDLLMFTIATPYPKTHLYDLVQKEGIIHGDYWREFVLGLREDSIPYLVPDAEKWIRKAYQSFYFRPSYMLKILFKLHDWRGVKNYIDAARGILCFKMKSDFN
jgi:radical SAM superfamily enzyme YgiQ (UPF0313 family)